MAKEEEQRTSAVMGRLLRYARPYVWPILLAIVLATVFSAGRYGRAYLMKPIFDDVIGPSQALREAGETLPLAVRDLVPSVGALATPEAATEGETITEGEAIRRLHEQVSHGLAQVIFFVLLIVLVLPFVPMVTLQVLSLCFFSLSFCTAV